MRINERLKELRNNLGISQDEMAKRLNFKNRSTIANIETGKRELTERNIKIICETFKINEKWLTEGTGEIFKDSEEKKIEEIYKENELNSFDKMFIENYIKLNKDERKAVEKFIKGLIK